MSEAKSGAPAAHAHGGDHAHDEHGVQHYLKIYYWLMGLFLVSVCGPLLEIKILTLITAFGIAVVKAYLVAANFMHLKIERKLVTYLLLTAIAFMFLFYAGVAPDVMKHRGRQWENVSAQEEVKRALSAPKDAHGHEAGEHEGGH